MKQSDVITLVFTLPEGEKLEGNKLLEGWLSATLASCDYQGIGCVVSLNGTPYKPDQDRIKKIRKALQHFDKVIDTKNEQPN